MQSWKEEREDSGGKETEREGEGKTRSGGKRLKFDKENTRIRLTFP